VPGSVIKRIEAIDEKEKQEKTLVFSDINADPIGDGDDEDVTIGVDDNDGDATMMALTTTRQESYLTHQKKKKMK
jgi:hypothetical protein